MAGSAQTHLEVKLGNRMHEAQVTRVHPAWARLMEYCADLGHGEIEKLKIQDGVPVIADVVREKVKFT
jgi:ribosomal protein S12 methylthiotransferase accessory factor YcaO